MSYEPLPGLIPQRAIEFLKTLPPGHTIATKPLADAVDSDPNTVRMALQTAVTHGVVVRERKDGLFYWRMGKDVHTNSEPAENSSVLKPQQKWVHEGVDIDAATPRKVTVATPFPVPAAPVPHLESDPAPAAPDQALVPVPVPDVVAKVQHGSLAPFSFSWRMDGALTVSKHGGSVTITADEAEKVRRFLEQVRDLSL